MAAVVNAMVKRRDVDRVMWGSERRAKANLWGKASKQNYGGIKTEVYSLPREQQGGNLLIGPVVSGAEQA
jgi:hypothetical protein